jgi:hypothetical protein
MTALHKTGLCPLCAALVSHSKHAFLPESWAALALYCQEQPVVLAVDKQIYGDFGYINSSIQMPLSLLLSSAISVICSKSLYTSGDPGISFNVFRAGQCLSFNVGSVPFYYSFTASPSVTVTRYLANSDSTDSDIVYNGTTPDIPSTDRIEDGPTQFVFWFSEDTYFSIAYAGFSTFNCSTMVLSDSESIVASDYLPEPLTTSVCLFYGAHGTHTISGSMGEAGSYPTIEIYSGMKHRLAQISSQVSNFTFTQPGTDIPTFVVVTPAVDGVTAPEMRIEMKTDGNFSGNTEALKYWEPPAFKPPEPVLEQRHSGDIPAISFIGIFGSGIVILIVFVVCKERNWYRDDFASMDLGMLSYESHISSYLSQEVVKDQRRNRRCG